MEITKYITLFTNALSATQTFKQRVYLGIAEGIETNDDTIIENPSKNGNRRTTQPYRAICGI